MPAFSGVVGLTSRLFVTTLEVLVSGAASRLEHLAPVRLADLKPLKLVVPTATNTRRRRLETYFASNGVEIEQMLELDAMMGTLDFVASGDWVTVLPGLMMVGDLDYGRLTINPLAMPPLPLDLALIEPARKALTPAAQAFLDTLTEESVRLNAKVLAIA